ASPFSVIEQQIFGDAAAVDRPRAASHAQRPRERRAIHDDGVILALFAARIDAESGEVVEHFRDELTPEVRLVELARTDRDDACTASQLKKLTIELARGDFPQRLDCGQAMSGTSCLGPFTVLVEEDVAE